MDAEKMINAYVGANFKVNIPALERQGWSIWMQLRTLLHVKNFSLERIMKNFNKILPVLFNGHSMPYKVKECISIIKHRHRRFRRFKKLLQSR